MEGKRGDGGERRWGRGERMMDKAGRVEGIGSGCGQVEREERGLKR